MARGQKDVARGQEEVARGQEQVARGQEQVELDEPGASSTLWTPQPKEVEEVGADSLFRGRARGLAHPLDPPAPAC